MNWLLWHIYAGILWVAVGLPGAVYGDVTSFPFSTTFNCAASVQNDWFPGGSTGCDGINAENDSPSGASNESAITATANYPSGGGGLGFQYWVNDSNGDNSNPNDVSSYLAYDFSAQANLYIRWHFKHQSGLNIDSSGGSHKFLYFNGSKCQGHASGCYAVFEPSGIRLHIGGGADYTNANAWGWDSFYPPSGASDGQWHCSQLEVQTGTGTNGVVRWTIDGTQRLYATNVNWGGTAGFTGFILPANGVFDTRTAGGDAPMYMWFDDVSISTTSMPSCLSGSSASAIATGSASFTGSVRIQ